MGNVTFCCVIETLEITIELVNVLLRMHESQPQQFGSEVSQLVNKALGTENKMSKQSRMRLAQLQQVVISDRVSTQRRAPLNSWLKKPLNQLTMEDVLDLKQTYPATVKDVVDQLIVSYLKDPTSIQLTREQLYQSFVISQ